MFAEMNAFANTGGMGLLAIPTAPEPVSAPVDDGDGNGYRNNYQGTGRLTPGFGGFGLGRLTPSFGAFGGL